MSHFVHSVGFLRTPVASFNALPLTSNVQGDIRVALDIGVAFTWTSASSSGTSTDWSKLTVSQFSDLQGIPGVTTLDIDNAVQSLRSVYLNLVTAFFKNTILYSQSILKMVEGVLDNFNDTNGVDLVASSNAVRLTMLGFPYQHDPETQDSFYVPSIGNFDDKVKILIQGYNFGGGLSHYSSLRQKLGMNTTEPNIDYNELRFGQPTIYIPSQGFWLQDLSNDANPNLVSGKNFTVEFNFKINAETAADTGLNFGQVASAGTSADESPGGAGNGFHIHGEVGEAVTVHYVSASNTIDITGTTVLADLTWYHIAVVRQSGVLKLYVNGTLEATAGTTDNLDIINSTLGYGFGSRYNTDPLGQTKGWLAEFRYSKDIARYTSNFTPLTIPFNASSSPTPLDAETKLLAHFDGTDAATAYTAESGQTLTFAGNAQLDTAQKKFGTSSLLVNGTGDYVTVPDSSDWDFGTGDLTIECWIRFDTVGSSSSTIISLPPAGFSIQHTGSAGGNKISDGASTVVSTTSVVAGSWYHIAITVDGGFMNLYVDGKLEASASFTTPINTTGTPKIGGGTYSAWIDEVRISKGIARYYSTFTLPTERGASGDSKLLFHFDEAEGTTSLTEYGHGYGVSINGAGYITRTQSKFSPGSFRGTGQADFIGAPNYANTALGTSDFTIDCWIRLDNITATHLLWSDILDADNFITWQIEGTVMRLKSVTSTVTDLDMTRTLSIAANIWYHVAITRSGTSFRMFLNGLPQGNVATSAASLYSSNNYTNIGGFVGYMDEFRFSKDLVRWTTDFTPSAIAFTGSGYTPVNNMVLQSNGFDSGIIPTSARIVIVEEDDYLQLHPRINNTVNLNQDIKAYVSRDGGTTFTQAALVNELDILTPQLSEQTYFLSSTLNLLVGTVDLTSQPNGKEVVYKITTHNNKKMLISAVALNWK